MMTDDELNKAFQRDVLTRAIEINATLQPMTLEETMAQAVIFAKKLTVFGDETVSGRELVNYAIALSAHLKHEEIT